MIDPTLPEDEEELLLEEEEEEAVKENDPAAREREERDREERDVRLKTKKKVVELESAFKEFSGHKMLITINGPPDPDSIASALTHKYIAQNFGVDVQIMFFDPISHAENRALVRQLEIELLLYKPEIDLSEYSCFALVDTQSQDNPALEKLPTDTPCFSVVDHHKKTGLTKAIFTDIRENAGATSSIYAEYLKYGSYTLSQSSLEDSSLATALHHGIRSDTDNFFLAREIDWKAGTYLSRFVDRDVLRTISESSVTASTMDILQKALANNNIRDNYLFAGVNYVRDSDRDGIAQAADYLVRREGIETVIVFGIVDDKLIHGSLRTRSTTMDPDAFLKSVLGADKATGKYYGGGRLDKGGFQIPLDIFTGCPDRELLWQTVSKTITAYFLKTVGGI